MPLFILNNHPHFQYASVFSAKTENPVQAVFAIIIALYNIYDLLKLIVKWWGAKVSLGLKRNIVELVEHDPQWEKIAFQTIQQLWRIFGSAAKDIQHIGSTSIQNIKAKPIIDIAVAINDFSEVESLFYELENNGFSNRGWFSDQHIIFTIGKDIPPDDRITTHNIHIVKIDSAGWLDHINFRDYLNAHPHAAKDYETLKIKLAYKYPYDEGRKKYGDGKSDFINNTLEDAAKWLCQS